MIFKLAVSILLAASASATPFAPAKSNNNAKAKYVSKLVNSAKVTRRLDEAEDAEIDISSYSLKFEQCQFVKTYSDELAEDEDYSSVLKTQRFVVFRLCPDNSCSSCNSNYGEYVIDLQEYLESTVEYQQEIQEQMCELCEEYYENQAAEEEEEEAEEEEGDEDEDGDDRRKKRRLVDVDYDSCYDECQKIENMEENGYVDATNYLECQQIYEPEDDGMSALYAGPICSSSGSKIKIGVFTDEECNVVSSSKEVEDYLIDDDGVQMKLSHALLKSVYSEDSCISCLEPAEEEEENDDEEEDEDEDAEEEAPETAEVCRNLYEAAAKCEDSNGFEASVWNGDDDAADAYDNQEEQEELVCDYISSLKSGTYDETGEIVVQGGTSVVGGGAKTTGGQKFALTFFILGTVGLSGYAAMLHGKLSRGGKTDLANQGGAMA